MANIELDERLMNIEIALTTQERIIDDLNQIVIMQGKQLEHLQKQNKILFERLENETVKPQSEETPPPHY